MCEQCATEAVLFRINKSTGVEEDGPLPGYALMQATQDGLMMKAGQFGLVRCNDPDLIWTIRPIADTPLTEDAYFEGVIVFEEELSIRHSLSWLHIAPDLVQAALKVGYDRAKDGSFPHWLFNRLGAWLDTHDPIHHSQ